MSNRRKIDLDAARKAKAELAADTAPIITLGGIDYELPVSLPAGAILALAGMVAGGKAETRDEQIAQSLRQAEAFRTAVMGLFGPRADEIINAGVTIDEILEIVQQAYGEDEETEGVGETLPE